MAKSSLSRNDGFSLVEVMIATCIMAASLVSLAQMFALSTRTNMGARNTTYAAVLAQQKLEELKSLTWGFDPQGLPISDFSSDTTVTPELPAGGTGLSPSSDDALRTNTTGYVDYIDAFGNKLGTGTTPPDDAIYTRRWSISPLPTNPNNTIVIQVLVTRLKDRGVADDGAVKRLPEEARMVAVKTRKAH